MINTHTHAYSGVDRVTTSTPGHDYRDAESLPYTIADLQLEFPITPTHVMRYCRRQDWYHLIGLATGDKCCGWWQGGGVVEWWSGGVVVKWWVMSVVVWWVVVRRCG